jgi:hypothetical protein
VLLIASKKILRPFVYGQNLEKDPMLTPARSRSFPSTTGGARYGSALPDFDFTIVTSVALMTSLKVTSVRKFACVSG